MTTIVFLIWIASYLYLRFKGFYKNREFRKSKKHRPKYILGYIYISIGEIAWLSLGWFFISEFFEKCASFANEWKYWLPVVLWAVSALAGAGYKTIFSISGDKAEEDRTKTLT